MSIVLVGGMDRLGEQYQKEAKSHGVELRIYSQTTLKMASKIKHADAVVTFTNKVSHKARNEALAAAKKQDIPVFVHHACGVCTLQQCLTCLKTMPHTMRNETERQANLALFKNWVGSWNLKRWADSTKDELNAIKVAY